MNNIPVSTTNDKIEISEQNNTVTVSVDTNNDGTFDKVIAKGKTTTVKKPGKVKISKAKAKKTKKV